MLGFRVLKKKLLHFQELLSRNFTCFRVRGEMSLIIKGSFSNTYCSFFFQGVQFYTQLKTITSQWKEEDATVARPAVVMPTMGN